MIDGQAHLGRRPDFAGVSPTRTVTKMLQAAIIEDDYFNPVVIYRWLRANFVLRNLKVLVIA